MKRSAPMKRTGFKRTAPPEPAPREERVLAPVQRLARPATYAVVSGQVNAAPKTVARRSPALLEMANGRPCLLMVPGVCNFDPATTVACHSNWSTHGKGGSRKADDHYTCWGCSSCHAWLDQGSALELHKQHIFALAMTRQVRQWARLVDVQSLKPRERTAVAWALDNLLLDGAVDAALTQFFFRFAGEKAA